MALPLRFEIFARRFLKPTDLENTEEVGLGRMLQFLAQPSASARGAKYITRKEESGSWTKAFLLGHPNPIFWPKEDDFSSMEVIVGEQFFPNEWHRYLIPETRIYPGDVVVDCGAAEGLFTYLAAPTAKKVYAIEPMPRFQEAMRLTFASTPNVEIVPYALGSSDGQAELVCYSVCSNILGVGSNEGKETVTVKVVTLDNLFAGQTVDYLKADIEGLEMDVLEGGRDLIFHSKPRLAITTYHELKHSVEIASFLRKIHPAYQIKCKGVSIHGAPLMLHAWI